MTEPTTTGVGDAAGADADLVAFLDACGTADGDGRPADDLGVVLTLRGDDAAGC